MMLLAGCATQRSQPIPQKPQQQEANPYKNLKPLSKAVTDRTLNVAALLPLSGPHAHLGDSIRRSMELGLFGTPMSLEITFVDTGGTPEGAVRAVKTAKYFKAQAIVGPLFASEVQAVTPLFQAHGIPVLALSNDRRVAQPGVFTLGSTPLEEVHSVLTVAQKRGAAEVTVLLPETEGHEALRQNIENLNLKPGMPQLRIVSYKPTLEGFTQLASELKAHPQQALLFMEGGSNLDLLVQGLQQRGIPFQGRILLGLQGLCEASPSTLVALQGALYAMGQGSTDAFVREYLKAFRETPPQLAILGQEAVQILVHAISEAPDGRVRLPGTWPTTSGEVKIMPTGETARSTKVYELTATGSTEVRS